MTLPSASFLQHYKNIIEQGPGFRPLILKLMFDTAKSKNLPRHAYYGARIFDEMAIQLDLQIDNKGGDFKLCGAAHYGVNGDNIEHTVQAESVSFVRCIWDAVKHLHKL